MLRSLAAALVVASAHVPTAAGARPHVALTLMFRAVTLLLASATASHALDDGLALTPPMGWR